jgi:hypothetical protein
MVASRIKKFILRFLARRTRPLPLHRWQALPRRAVKLCSCRFRVHIAVHIAIGAQKFMRESREHFVCLQSARGLAHSKTLRVFQESSCRAQRPGLRRPSAAFPRDISNRANVNRKCYSLLSVSIRGYKINAGIVTADWLWPGVFPSRLYFFGGSSRNAHEFSVSRGDGETTCQPSALRRSRFSRIRANMVSTL